MFSCFVRLKAKNVKFKEIVNINQFYLKVCFSSLSYQRLINILRNS